MQTTMAPGIGPYRQNPTTIITAPQAILSRFAALSPPTCSHLNRGKKGTDFAQAILPP
ncbi:hypothetical protein ACRALDRAFT_207077 [Sodiomyces alcalophilus JCM 7366]|uniref:uncharacterized protein n=1 Tax=Sodiomyces alcalophilus JCM 7366 TaxID=591952 RepID=UPI0039B365E6